MTFSAFSDRYAKQYGVPAYMLDSAAAEFGAPWATHTEELARDLRTEYDKTGNWNRAIDNVAEQRGKADAAAAVKKSAGVVEESGGWFDGWGSDVLDADKWAHWAKSGFVVVFGAVFIVLAVLAFKPARDAAGAVLLRKGAKK